MKHLKNLLAEMDLSIECQSIDMNCSYGVTLDRHQFQTLLDRHDNLMPDVIIKEDYGLITRNSNHNGKFKKRRFLCNIR
jgi:hypothetical protein